MKKQYLTSKLIDLNEGTNYVWHWGIKMALAVDPKYVLIYASKEELSLYQLSALKRATQCILNREPRFTLQTIPCRP